MAAGREPADHRGVGGTALVLALAGTLLVYIKRLEEGELAERFGEACRAYRRATPFNIPRLPPRRGATGRADSPAEERYQPWR